MTGSKAAQTAAAIEDAALELVRDRGYERVTVDAICERVGVSQRTFFNHFRTKDDALLGTDRPVIDERAARRFILSEGPLLLDALSLIELPSTDGVRRIGDRMRIVSATPVLLAKQMERIAAIDEEITEIVALRLAHQHPETSAEGIAQEASMTTHLLAGVLRWIALNVADIGSSAPTFRESMEGASTTLERVLRDSCQAT